MNDLISRQAAIDAILHNQKVYSNNFGDDPIDKYTIAIIDNDAQTIAQLPSADRQTDEEDQLKFYYVESIDDYWIGMRIDNFYYAEWCEGLGFVWTHSRYLPWGKHITDEKTLWKEHTYPSEPAETPFTDWIVGFVKKYFADRAQGEWIVNNYKSVCSACGANETDFIYGTEMWYGLGESKFCPSCGARMKGASDETY